MKAKTNPSVDVFIEEAETWKEETQKLRAIALDCGLTEELKWAKPCYTFKESNVVIIQGFKEYCALMFCKGALLKDPEGILKKPGESSQAARQIRFTSAQEVVKMKPIVKAYIREAIEAEKAGLQIVFKKNPEPVPEELQKRLNENAALRAAFGALTPGRQRGYILIISAAKQSQTRAARVEKCVPRILKGKGLND
jgi:uncharacterized protein YdeI (YjbR/CyaY-like superfamily)